MIIRKIKRFWYFVKGMEAKYFRLTSHNGTSRSYNKKLLFVVVVASIISIAFWYYVSIANGISNVPHVLQHFTKWPIYENKMKGKEAYLSYYCFGEKLKSSLAFLEDNIKKLRESSSETCREILTKFTNMYSVSHRVGEIRMPPTFKLQVLKWLNNNEELLNEMNKQYVIHIYNEYAEEHSVFSPLRSKRPQSKSGIDPYKYVLNVVAETSVNCDFCDYMKHTSEDTFGRIMTNSSVSAANTFKVDKWHSLIITFKHSILEMTESDVIDMYTAAKLWMEKVHNLDSAYKYPWIMWDVMPHAGASQVHPHIHVGITPDYYVGVFESLRRGAQLYYEQFNNNYFTDLVEIHTTLGLSVTLGEATAIAQLTSKKDTEITILSDEPNLNFFQLIYYTVKAYMDMGYYDFSSLCVLPIMDSSDTKGSLPAVMRIATRGNVADIKSEISSFEFFQFSNLNLDPYKVIQALKKSLNRR